MTVIEDSKKTVGTAAMGFCSGREIGPNSEYRTGKWECIAQEPGGRSEDGQLLRRNIRSEGDSG